MEWGLSRGRVRFAVVAVGLAVVGARVAAGGGEGGDSGVIRQAAEGVGGHHE